MIQKEGLIEDITAVLQCLFDKQKNNELSVNPLVRASNIWGGHFEDLGNEDSFWIVQLEHEELEPGIFRFMSITINDLTIFEGEDFNALQASDIHKDEVTFIYKF